MPSAPDDGDRGLGLRAGAGDRDALAALYDRHKHRLLGFLRRMVGARGHAEDVFQDVWMKVMNTLSRFDPDRGPFRGWLYTIASNAAIDHLRAEAMRSRGAAAGGEMPDIEGPAAPSPGPERIVLAREQERRLRRALATLQPHQRLAILLRHQAGFTYAEIAAMLSVPEGTAKTLVHRGVLTVRNLIKEPPS